MNLKQIIALVLVLLVGTVLSFLAYKTAGSASGPAASSATPHGHDHDDDHGAHPGAAHEDEAARGPHGGRMLEDGSFALEITIFESGVPPQFRVYPFQAGEPVDPAQVDLTLQLHRLGGRVDTIRFQPEGDFLKGDQIVVEPHSFAVEVVAQHAGATHDWAYESYEGRTELSPAAVRESGIEMETVGPREISESILTYGRIAPNEDRLAYVIPRFPGRVTEIRKRLGEPVAQGEVLARVESNESLQTYDVLAPLAGTVIAKNVNTGESTRPDQAIYTVANLEEVWVDLDVYPRDFARIAVGQRVTVELGDAWPAQTGEISYLSPFGAENSQTMLARVVLPNPQGYLRPGLFVSARIEVARATVPLAVKASALQTFRDWQVVFVKVGDIFEFRPVELGRRDDQWVEVISGLEAGQAYAAENSFIIKADILKSGAAHDH